MNKKIYFLIFLSVISSGYILSNNFKSGNNIGTQTKNLRKSRSTKNLKLANKIPEKENPDGTNYEENISNLYLFSIFLFLVSLPLSVPIIIIFKNKIGFDKDDEDEKASVLEFYKEMDQHYKMWTICKKCDLDHEENDSFCYNCGNVVDYKY
jgi:hypothetical protein